jgi:signal transduction histidine kinase
VYSRRKSFIWLIPILMLFLGVIVVVWASLERQKVNQELEKILEEHVESVARLIFEGTREATEAIDLIYILSEDNLNTAVELLGDLDTANIHNLKLIESVGLQVWVAERTPKIFEGSWGPVGPEKRAALIREITSAESGEIVEIGQAGRLGLFCAHFELKWGHVLVCKDAQELTRLRRETGLGPLLREVVGQGVLYTAIQDETGILASSPGADLSAWENDPILEQARKKQGARLTFRTLEADLATLFEGLGPFPLPDGSTAILRVGVDASHVFEVQAGIDRRHRLLFAVVVMLIGLSIVGVWLLGRRDKRRLEIEQRLAEREEQNRHWQAIGQMAATVAHEVRNPLNTLKMAAQRLGREFSVGEEDAPEYKELIGLLGSETDRVDAVVTEFLELGRPLTLQLEKLPVARALDESLLPLRLRAEREEKQLVLECNAQDQVSLDKRRFVQIISNLVGNALDAVGQNGIVKVSAQTDASGLNVFIEDNGPGMDAETLAKIQKPFETTKAAGTGLGLPLARRLVEAHGGKLSMSSNPGQGTRVHVFLPEHLLS